MFSLWLRPDRHDPESLGATSLSFFAGKALCPPRPWAAWAASLPPPPGARQGKPLGPPGLQKVTIEARPRGALLGPQGGGSEGAGHFSVGSGHLVISARCLCRVRGGGVPMVGPRGPATASCFPTPPGRQSVKLVLARVLWPALSTRGRRGQLRSGPGRNPCSAGTSGAQSAPAPSAACAGTCAHTWP